MSLPVKSPVPSIPAIWKAWTAVLSLTLLATILVAHGLYPPTDILFSRELQSLHSTALQPLSTALYDFGMTPYYPLVALGAVAWLVWNRRYAASGFVATAVASRALVILIKDFAERPRPTSAQLSFVEGASGFSFPSGHVFGTVLLVGAIWFVFMQVTHSHPRRWALTVAALSWVILMGLQRIYAGAHWASDVLGAYLWGGLLLFLLIQVYLRIESGKLNFKD